MVDVQCATNELCIAPSLARFGAQSMDGLMEQLREVIQIVVYNIVTREGKTSAKRALSLIVSWPGDRFHPTPTATLSGGCDSMAGTFNEQQTTFV